MKSTVILVVVVAALTLARAMLGAEIVVVDQKSYVPIPDRGEYAGSYVVSEAPLGAQITGVWLELVIRNEWSDDFWCGDYKITLSSDARGGPSNSYLFWGGVNAKTDAYTDDDSADDSDIELSRWTTAFNGQSPQQRWYICIKDTVSFHPASSSQRGYGYATRLKLVIRYELPPRLYVSANATGKNNGSTWTDAFVHLQDALALARPGEQIWVAQGTYRPDRGHNQQSDDRFATFELHDGVTVIGGHAGPRSPDPNLRDVDLYRTILSGDLAGNDRYVSDPGDLLTEPAFAENSFHVVTAINCGEMTVLDGLTITAGNANGRETSKKQGGGLFSAAASLIVRDCTFTRNAANSLGAGMYCDSGSNGQLVLIRCNFIENASEQGAGMYSHSGTEPDLSGCLFDGNIAAITGAAIEIHLGQASLSDCLFINNRSDSGGALYASDSQYTLTQCTFEGNRALRHGGAIADINSVSELADCEFRNNVGGSGGAGSHTHGSLANIVGSRFIDNEAEVDGGGLYSDAGVQVLTDCWFSNNNSDQNGGAIYNYGGPLSVINCRLTGNTATRSGGAIFNSNGETLYLGSLFSGNAAIFYGGAVANLDCQNSVRTVNCTIIHNRSEGAGGGTADVNGINVMVNSILWANQAPSGTQALVSDGTASLTVRNCNLQGGQAGMQVVDAQLAWQSGNLASDPLLEDGYGPNLTAGSPCIDAGDNTGVTSDIADVDGDDDTSERIPLDIIGAVRFIDDPATPNTGNPDFPNYPEIIDIGAVEYSGSGCGQLKSYAFYPYSAYFHCNPKIDEATLQKFDQETQDYFWEYINQLEENGVVEIPKPFDLVNCQEPNNCSYTTLTATEWRRILAAKTAHSIWLDKNDMLPWTIRDYTQEQLRGLFDKTLLFTQSGRDYYYSSLVDHSPSEVFGYILQKQLIRGTLLDTFYAVFDDLRSDFRHGDTSDPDRNTAYTLLAALTTFDAKNMRVSRAGCHSSTRIALGILRCINIPGEQVNDGSWYEVVHSSAVWSVVETVMPHGDNIYDALLSETPTSEFLPTFSFYEENQDNAPCYGDHVCLSHRHVALNAIAYPSPWLLARCCDPAQYNYASSREPLDLYLGPYLTAEELYQATALYLGMCGDNIKAE
jgi:predicted outer membrane repeat protein